MRVGIDYRSALERPAGIGRFTRELVAALASLRDPGLELALYAVLFRRFASRAAAMPPPSPGVVPCLRRVPGKLLRLASRLLPVSAETLLGPVDLFHFTDYTPIPVRTKHVLITVHDVSYEVGPQWYHEGTVRRLRAFVEGWIERGASVLTVTESSRREIASLTGARPERIHVAPLGVDPALFRPRTAGEVEPVLRRHGIEGPYFLFAGTLQPRKNVEALLGAHARARASGVREAVVLVGAPGWKCAEVVERIERGARDGSVRWLGYAPEADLAALLSGATAVVVPSHHEGFGLPLLEGMASGTAVVASRAAALVEVAAGAALHADATEEGLAEALVRVASDPGLRTDLVGRGRARARAFAWESCARRVRDVYREVAS